MPDKRVIDRAKRDLAEGKSASTAAGEFVREEIEHVRQGKHGARSPQQAIAIGLSEARRAGIPLPPPREKRTSEKTRLSAERVFEVGQKQQKPRSRSRKRSNAVERALKRERRSSVSRSELSKAAQSGWAKRRATGSRPAPRSAASRTASRRQGARKSR